jgi:thiol-disulfide isomerase/thioredoxin
MKLPNRIKTNWHTWVPQGAVLVVLLIALLWIGLAPLGHVRSAGILAMPAFAAKVAAPDFPAGLEWLNTDRPLSLRDLRGKIVLLDFWTYCCINCMHIIPDLKKLEAKYPNELVVIGVHSAKFTGERETDNIRQAVLRYEIEHPVVNDRDMVVWGEFAVHAWPTVVLIDPEGKVVATRSGEGVFEPMDRAIADLLREFGGKLDRTPRRFQLERDAMPEPLLAFPGKVLADEKTRQLFIADSNHNRIVVVSLEDATIKAIIGGGEIGLEDGAFEEARFHHPQGMAFDGKALYVADTENHAIRCVDFDKRRVETIAGTGEQARRTPAGGVGRTVALSSPWDLVLHNGTLYIAMAGTHQLWRMNLASGRLDPHAGSGAEARIDGPLLNAALAQPSGLATDGAKLYFADSEDSSIRAADLDPKGAVTTIVGGDLFEFGDRDGKGLEARLQHPLGVAYHNGVLYVADTYNNKIKIVSPKDRASKSFLGTGKAGLEDGESARFDEPGGVSVAGGKLYIADTNNHAVRVADLATRRVETLMLREMERRGLTVREGAERGERREARSENGEVERSSPTVKEGPSTAPFCGEKIDLPAQTVRPGKVILTIALDLPPDYKLNEQAPSAVIVNTSGTASATTGPQTIRKPKFPLRIPLDVSGGAVNLQVDLNLYYCQEGKESLCYFKALRITLPVKTDTASANTALSIAAKLPAGSS